MDILLFLIPVALLLALTALASFMWSVHSRQYEDLTGSSLRILADDDLEMPGHSGSEYSDKR